MTGRDFIFMGIGALVLVSLSALGDFVSKVDSYSKADDIIRSIGTNYNEMRSGLEMSKGMAQQAIGISQDTKRQVQDLQYKVSTLEKERTDIMQYIDKRLAEHSSNYSGQSTSSYGPVYSQ